jgi:multiple sugar transport system permease protein
MRTSNRYSVLALTPPLALFLVILVFPTAYVLNLMLQHYSLTDITSNRYVGIDNFTRLVGESRFWAAGLRSLIFSGVSMAVSIPVLRGTTVLRAALIIPMVLSPLVVGAVFRFMFASGGLVDWLLGLVGIHGTAFLSRPGTALVTIALIDSWQWTPFVAIVAAAGMEAMPRDVLEAARLDGVNAWQEMWHFTLPLIRPLLALVALIRFMDSFREFDKPFITTNGGPGTSSETLPIYLYKFAFQYYDMGYAAAVGFVMLVFISIVSTYIVRWMRASRGVAE